MMKYLEHLSDEIKQYLIITGNYWAFTLTDGALRMLVVLYFYQLGYAPLAIALLFVFYEFFGVITNLVGGWIGAKIGLNKTMEIGLSMQVGALLMLAVPQDMLSVFWVMIAQAISGIAKDLNKMSAKSSIKTLVPKAQQGALYKWVALLTGSKNTLKGIGFFLGGLMLTLFGFQQAVALMALGLIIVTLISNKLLKQEVGKAKVKPKFSEIFSKNKSLNYLSAARLFLFAARDIWFVIAVPVFLGRELGWSHHLVGTFMACWVIGYGVVQAFTPRIIQVKGQQAVSQASLWAAILSGLTLVLVIALTYASLLEIDRQTVLVSGLLGFGGVFAINSALHSYVIVAIAKEDGVSMDVGFYYMANAMGRLLGTVLSGVIFQLYGLVACLLGATLMAIFASFLMKRVTLAE